MNNQYNKQLLPWFILGVVVVFFLFFVISFYSESQDYFGLSWLRWEIDDLLLIVLVISISFNVVTAIILVINQIHKYYFIVSVLGLIFTVAILDLLFFNHALNVVRRQEEPLSYASTILTWTGLLVTLVTVITGIVSYVVTEKVTQIRESQDRLYKNIVATSEIALRFLPGFEESQQVPIRCLESLEQICEVVFDDPDNGVVEYLDRIGNGSKLKLAKATMLYGKNECAEAIQILDSALKTMKNKDGQKKNIWYRYGMLCRQSYDYKNSLYQFEKLISYSKRNGDNAFVYNGCIGVGITLLAIYRNNKVQELWVEVVSIVRKVYSVIGINSCDDILEYAFSLLKYVYENNCNNVMGSMYLAKISNEILEYKTPDNPALYVENRTVAAKATLEYLNRMSVDDDLNLEANYEFSRVLCCYYLGYEKMIAHLEKAIRLGESMITAYPDFVIYSEFSERLVYPEEWKREVEGFKQWLNS